MATGVPSGCSNTDRSSGTQKAHRHLPHAPAPYRRMASPRARSAA